MNAVKPSPFSSRTKSLRERFASKRSYSENFKDPPPAAGASEKDSVRNVRPSLPSIGLGEAASPPQRRQVSVLAEHFNPFAALPEETYCSALDINSHQGDPRFPWQRDAAVQCDLSPTGEGYRYTRKDSFYMLSKEANRMQKDLKLPKSATSPVSSAEEFAAALPTEQSSASITEKFKEVYWRNLSICSEEDETTLSAIAQAQELAHLKDKKPKKTSMLQRAMSERGRSRRLQQQASLDESRPPQVPAQQRQVIFVPPHIQPLGTTSSDDGGPDPNATTTAGKMVFNSAPTSRTETPPSDNSPQTPPPPVQSSNTATPPSRRNSERRKLCFVRKNTNSAPDSFDDGGPESHPETPDKEAGDPVGYFNFDSMQRLLDLSMTVSATKPEKPTFLLTPGGLAVGKDKSGAYMTLPSPNVQNPGKLENAVSKKSPTNTPEQDGPNVFKKLSSLEDEESEHEEVDNDPPPASALHRRRALVPPKMLTDGYESATEENDQHSPSGPQPTSVEGSSNQRRRRSSIVVIPPMQICPGDLLVYSKVLTQRNTLLDIDGSTQSLGVSEDTSRKAKNSWSLLRLFDRSSRSKSESLCGLEEVLSSLQPSEFVDEHLSKYKGMQWTEFVSLWEGRTRRNADHKSLRPQSSKWLSFSDITQSSPRVSKGSDSSPTSTTSGVSSGDYTPTRHSCSHEIHLNDCVSSSTSSFYAHHNGGGGSGERSSEFRHADSSCAVTLDEIEHQIHNLGALTRSRNELKRREALWDLFQSECMFLYDHLMVLKNVFMEPLKKIQVEGFAMFAEPEVLFGNLDELCCVTYSFCKEFLSLILQKMSGDEIDTTEVLVKLFQKSAKANALTQAYHRYTLNYINALNYLETLRRQVEFNEFEKWCSRDPRCKKLQLTDLLVSPVQHVMRVPLILKEIEMRTEDSRDKQLISSIIESEENSLRELDDKMKWLKNFERLLEIQRSIVWPSVSELDPKAFIPDFLKQPLAKQPCERLIVSPRRQIVLEGSLHLLDSGKPSETFVLLFDDMLLITRRKKGLHKKKSSITENWASTSNKSSSSHEAGYKYVVYKQPLSLDRFFIHDVNPQDGAGLTICGVGPTCMNIFQRTHLVLKPNSLKNAFVLVCLNRFQQIVTVHTFQAPNEAVKAMWLSKLRDTMDRWKRTLQNTVFRNQRTSTASTTSTTPAPSGQRVVK